jgi:hypothetical protein
MTAKGSGGADRRRRDRKARLAAALRANLKRRKAKAPKGSGEAADDIRPERGDERR